MNWSSCCVGDLIDCGDAEVKTGPFGTQLRASDYVARGTPVINVRNIGYGTIREEKLEYISEDTVNRLSSHLLKPKDIVFGRKGAVERHVYIQSRQDRWFQGSDCLRLRLMRETRVSARFLSYLFLTSAHQSWMMQQCSHGATMASLNQDIIKRISLLLPPIRVQQRITTILSEYDDLIENNTRRIAILEEMAARLYEEWFVHFRFPGHEGQEMIEMDDGLIPAGWGVYNVRDVVTRLPNGRVYKEADVRPRGSIPVVDQSSSELMGFHDNLPDLLASPENPIVIFGDHTCKMQMMLRPFSLGPNTVSFVSKVLPVEYVFWLVRGLVSTREYKRHWNDLMKKPILVAPKSVATQFSNQAKPLAELTEILRQRNRVLRQARDLLLPKLISGEIDVSEVPVPKELVAA